MIETEADWEEYHRMKENGFKTTEEELDSMEHLRKLFVDTLHKFIVAQYPQIIKGSRAVDVDISIFIQAQPEFKVNLEELKVKAQLFTEEWSNYITVETPRKEYHVSDGRTTVILAKSA